MHSSLNRFVPALLIMAIFLAPVAARASVTAEVKAVVDRVVTIVSDKEMKNPKNESSRRAALEKTISTIFDYEEMAKLSLGVHWRERSAAERCDCRMPGDRPRDCSPLGRDRPASTGSSAASDLSARASRLPAARRDR